MKYISTRGDAPDLNFEEALLAGLATDGGLYVPAEWPKLDAKTLRSFQNKSYQEIAVEVMLPFVGDTFDRETFTRLVNTAYGRFAHDAVVPMKQLDGSTWLMELFHGPTLAFKDVALQLLGLMFDEVLTRRGEKITIVGATSGDTGSAAIEACRDRDSIDIFILHPHNRTSEVQRRQMTSVLSDNVHNIALDGTFDDCQDMVKAMFADTQFRNDVNLSAVNSINWGRIMAQIVYYVTAAVRIGAPERSLDVIVPTGNFGNIYAAHAAKCMGLPIEILGVASNRNDILTRFFEADDMSIQGVEPSVSPSMDIQVSSNFERLLFDKMARDGDAVSKVMAEFRTSGKMQVPQGTWDAMKENFVAMSSSDEETLDEIKRDLSAYNEVIDPHTATGIRMANSRANTDRPVVVMATAHPAKFPDAVEKATGTRPELPADLKDLFEREERLQILEPDLSVVQAYVREHRVS
ncbi:MAG: threonine synthase [Alphaproteobacteria bacterium]